LTRTSRIEELLKAMGERGYWTSAEYHEVEEIVMSKQPFEIEGDWGDLGVRKYDRNRLDPPVDTRLPDERPGPKEASPLPEAPVERGSRLEGLAAVEERLAMMEATLTDLFAKLKALEERIIGDRA
jgi:hypothetical protein